MHRRLRRKRSPALQQRSSSLRPTAIWRDSLGRGSMMVARFSSSPSAAAAATADGFRNLVRFLRGKRDSSDQVGAFQRQRIVLLRSVLVRAVNMDCEKMMTFVVSMTLLLVVMDAVTSLPVSESESHEPHISIAKRDRRHKRHRSSASLSSAAAAELIPDETDGDLDVANSLPVRESSAEGVSSGERLSSGAQPRRRRLHRRSAAWWLQAALRMCDESRANRGGGGGRRCKELNVDNGRLRLQVRMEEQ